MDDVKRNDQINMLKACADFTETGEWPGLFSYPNCGWDLVQSGLATEDKQITTAGRAALYLLGSGDDPLPASQASQTITLPMQSS